MAAQQEHYVPQFLLRHFSVGNSDQIYVFDKKNDRSFKANIKKVASEKGFYDINVRGIEVSLESSLSNLETKASHAIKKLVRHESLSQVSEEERLVLATFYAAQFLRVKRLRDTIQQVNEGLEKKLRSLNAPEEQIKELCTFDAEAIKLLSLDMLTDIPRFVPHLLDKTWILFRSSKGDPLYISDSPVTLDNNLMKGPMGNLGLASPGIEIYCPVSDCLSLMLVCRSFEEYLRANYSMASRVFKANPELREKGGDPELLDAMISAVETGSCVPLVRTNVERHNSLQVVFSSRYVYSSTDDFDLPRTMVQDDPAFRSSHRISTE